MAKKKGKVQQGRAKQKQKSQRGNIAGFPSIKTSRQNRQILDYDDEEDNSYQGFRGFAQSRPAPDFPQRSTSLSLRHQSITFVSAGVNPSSIDRPPDTSKEPAIENLHNEKGSQSGLHPDSDDDDIDEDIDDSAIQINIMADNDVQLSETGLARMHISSPHEDQLAYKDESIHGISETSMTDNAVASDAPAFVVDTLGDPALESSFKLTTGSLIQRTHSPTPSNSSEEIVLFHGRNNALYKPRIIEEPVNPTTSVTHTPHVTDGLLRALEVDKSTPSPEKHTSVRQKYTTGDHPLPQEWTPAPIEPYWRKKKGKAPANVDPIEKDDEASRQKVAKQNRVQFADVQEPASYHDAEKSIATLQADWKDIVRAKQSTKNDEAKSKASKRRGKRGRKKGNRDLINAIFSDDEGSAEEAAYNDYMENLAAQQEAEDSAETNTDFALKNSAHSFALGGPSMYVDGRGYDDDELLSKQLQDAGIGGADIEEDWESDSNSVLNPDSDELSSEESLNASDLEDELEYTEQQQWEDEADIRRRRADNMTDEHIARLLAKQQELGYHGDELIIDDGADMASDGVGDVAAARAGIIALGKLTIDARDKNPVTNRRSRRNDDRSFPDASALADVLDQYGESGFDIMDFERPSLRPTKKGRKGKPPPEIEMLSDEGLQEELNQAWENDRHKKRQKKLEREELRAQGQLGPGGRRDYAELGVKYPQGMTLKQVHNELREFLLDDDIRQRAFPPMDKKDRKALHEISLVLQLTCKSQGAGKNRFPVLYKKSQTVAYSDDMWGRLMDASSRGFFTNRGKPSKFARSIIAENRRSGRGGGFDRSAVTLRNGEVVGAGARELGSENFGHRLMEKMGWTKGQALGKDGDGLLVPVEQRMRVGTAGLG